MPIQKQFIDHQRRALNNQVCVALLMQREKKAGNQLISIQLIFNSIKKKIQLICRLFHSKGFT